MKPISLLITSLLAACASSPPPAPAAPPSPALDPTAAHHDIQQAGARLADETAADHEKRAASVRKHLEETEARLFDAAKRGDAAAMAALYAPDAVLLPEQEEPVRGRAAILASLSWMKKAKVMDWVATVEELEVHGDTANEIGTEVVTLSFGPKAVTTRMKYLDVWKEQPDGSWLLYRRMFSSNAPQK